MRAFVSIAAALLAYALLAVAPPLGDEFSRGLGHPSIGAAVVAGTIVSTWLLRRLILRSSVASLFGVGTLLALLSAGLSAAILIVAWGVWFGDPPGGFVLSVLMAGFFALVACMIACYVTLPLGWFTVWLLRQCPEPVASRVQARGGARSMPQTMTMAGSDPVTTIEASARGQRAGLWVWLTGSVASALLYPLLVPAGLEGPLAVIEVELPALAVLGIEAARALSCWPQRLLWIAVAALVAVPGWRLRSSGVQRGYLAGGLAALGAMHVLAWAVHDVIGRVQAEIGD